MPWIVDVETAIFDRLEADTGTGGLVNASTPLVQRANSGVDAVDQGIFNGEAPARTVVNEKGPGYPYIVFNVFQDAVDEPAFDLEVVQVRVTLEVYAERDEKTSGSDGRSACKDILARLYGDALAQSDKVPTYGLHRWKPTLSGDWSATALVHQEHQQNHTENHWGYVDSYFLTVHYGG